MTTTTASTLMERLKSETAAMHADAESHVFQKNLAKGELPRDSYVAWLGQMLLVHRALEGRLRQLRASKPNAAKAVKDAQFQEPYLLEDLAYFGADANEIEPLGATARLISTIETAYRAEPLTALGFHYVLEGSNNGNKFIARAMQKALALSPGAGLKYLDPYGDEQRALWAAFKDDMNSVEFTPAEQDAIVGAAKAMFAGIGDLSTDLNTVVPARDACGPRCGCPHAAGR